MHYDIPSPQRLNELKQLITGTQTEQVKSTSTESCLERPMTKEELAAIVDYNLQNL